MEKIELECVRACVWVYERQTGNGVNERERERVAERSIEVQAPVSVNISNYLTVTSGGWEDNTWSHQGGRACTLTHTKLCTHRHTHTPTSSHSSHLVHLHAWPSLSLLAPLLASLFLSSPNFYSSLFAALTLSVWSVCVLRLVDSPLFTYVCTDVNTQHSAHPWCPYMYAVCRHRQPYIACFHWLLSSSDLLKTA